MCFISTCQQKLLPLTTFPQQNICSLRLLSGGPQSRMSLTGEEQRGGAERRSREEQRGAERRSREEQRGGAERSREEQRGGAERRGREEQRGGAERSIRPVYMLFKSTLFPGCSQTG